MTEEFREEQLDVEAEEAPPTFFSVAVVVHDRAYGGPEEGGWWYETYEPADGYGRRTKVFPTKEQAFRYAERLEAWIKAQGLNEGRRPVHSVLSDGVFEAHVFYGTYPCHLPERRPHYE